MAECKPAFKIPILLQSAIPDAWHSSRQDLDSLDPSIGLALPHMATRGRGNLAVQLWDRRFSGEVGITL